MSTSTSPGHLGQDEISLGELCLRMLRFFQQFYRLLIIPALLLALLAAWLTAQRPLYSVEALLEVPGISLEEWRQAQPYLWDRKWVEHSFTGDDPELAKLRQLAQTTTFWATAVQYRTSLSRDDVRDTSVAQIEKSKGLGLLLRLQVRDEAQAEHQLQLLTHHIRQSLLANDLLEVIRDGQKTLAKRPKLNIKRLKATFDIQQAEQRIADMRSVLERYPETQKMAPSTVLSVQGDGGKYLAPLPQIVALEATISEKQASLRKLQRDLSKLGTTERLFAGLDEVIRQAASGDEILTRLDANRDRLLANQSTLAAEQDEAVQELSLELDLAQTRQEAIGPKSRSSLSLQPVLTSDSRWVGTLTFIATFLVLSLWLAMHAWLREGKQILCWLPERARRHLIREQ